MSENHELPTISTKGRGAEKAFVKSQELLAEGERVDAFFYEFAFSVVLITDRRLFVGPYDKIHKAVEFPLTPPPRIERRGFTEQPFLVGTDQEAKFHLKKADLLALEAVLNDLSPAGSGPLVDKGSQPAVALPPPDPTTYQGTAEGAAVRTWIAGSGPALDFVSASLVDGESLIVFADKVGDTSFFVTNFRLGIVRTSSAMSGQIPAIYAQHRLTSVKDASFSKALKNIKVSVSMNYGSSYSYAKVRPSELQTVEQLTAAAISQAAPSGADNLIEEWAALDEELVATVTGYSWLDRMGDNKREVTAKGEGSSKDLKVYRRVLVQGTDLRLIDKDVSAEVSTNGGVQVTHRPTVSRMAAGAILPGSALIPGLAFQKKKTVDSRTTYFVCAHPEWMLDVNVNPDASGEALKAAKFINKQAESMASTSPAVVQPPAGHGSSGEGSPAERLREMKALLDEGLITQDDFDSFKKSVLGL